MVHTVIAALSLDFRDDAMIKRGVTETVLKEFCKDIKYLSTRRRRMLIISVDREGAHLSQSASPGAPCLHILQVPEGRKKKTTCLTFTKTNS